jgi:prepilin signal peptidase PulO-like enzyme (type II secretory pathway)
VVLSLALAVLAWVDWRTLRLPNAITLPLIGVGILYVGWWSGEIWASVIGAAVGYSVFVAIELLYRRVRGRAGLGRGDAKLLAAGGAWCGWSGLPFIVLVASGAALLAVFVLRERVEREAGRIAFGPFLAFGIGIIYWAQLLTAS